MNDKKGHDMKHIVAILFLVIITVFLTGCDKKNKGTEKEKHLNQLLKNIEEDTVKKKTTFLKLLKKQSPKDFYLAILSDQLNANNASIVKFSRFLIFLHSLIQKNPEKCFLYNFRAYIAYKAFDITTELHSAKIVKKFDSDDLSALILLAHSSFQQWEDEQAMKYLDAAEKKLCESVNDCKEEKKTKVLKSIYNLKEKIVKEKNLKKYIHRKTKIFNRKNCYFIDVKIQDARDFMGEDVLWSGNCENGWAEGKGELENKKRKIKMKVTMEKGKMSGPAEIVFGLKSTASDVIAKGILANGEYRGEWKFFNTNGEIFRHVIYNENGRADGYGYDINEEKRYAYEYEFDDGIPLRSTVVTCNYDSENRYELTPMIYRYINKEGYSNHPPCSNNSKIMDIKTGHMLLKKILSNEKEQITHINFEAVSKDCSLQSAIEFVKKELQKKSDAEK